MIPPRTGGGNVPSSVPLNSTVVRRLIRSCTDPLYKSDPSRLQSSSFKPRRGWPLGPSFYVQLLTDDAAPTGPTPSSGRRPAQPRLTRVAAARLPAEGRPTGPLLPGAICGSVLCHL
jgi:hypothetical protein